MDKKLNLSDYNEWKKANKNKFSKVSYNHGVISTNNLSSDLYFTFLDMCWPEFIEFNNMVFIKDSYEVRQDIVLDKSKNAQEKEYWTNLLCIDGLFNDDIDEDKLDFLSKKLAESWKAKLKQDFPNREFNIIVVNDADDVAVSFQQIDSRA